MSKQIEALKLALEALESSRVFVTTREKIKHPEGTEWYDQAITAIKEELAQPDFEKIADDLQNICDKQALKLGHLEALLAQPEQEPVGEIVDAIEGAFKCSFAKILPVGTKLYTTQPPCPTCEGLARTVMMDQTGRDA